MSDGEKLAWQLGFTEKAAEGLAGYIKPSKYAADKIARDNWEIVAEPKAKSPNGFYSVTLNHAKAPLGERDYTDLVASCIRKIMSYLQDNDQSKAGLYFNVIFSGPNSDTGECSVTVRIDPSTYANHVSPHIAKKAKEYGYDLAVK